MRACIKPAPATAASESRQIAAAARQPHRRGKQRRVPVRDSDGKGCDSCDAVLKDTGAPGRVEGQHGEQNRNR